jgi:hypothetical protein
VFIDWSQGISVMNLSRQAVVSSSFREQVACGSL